MDERESTVRSTRASKSSSLAQSAPCPAVLAGREQGRLSFEHVQPLCKAQE